MRFLVGNIVSILNRSVHTMQEHTGETVSIFNVRGIFIVLGSVSIFNKSVYTMWDLPGDTLYVYIFERHSSFVLPFPCSTNAIQDNIFLWVTTSSLPSAHFFFSIQSELLWRLLFHPRTLKNKLSLKSSGCIAKLLRSEWKSKEYGLTPCQGGLGHNACPWHDNLCVHNNGDTAPSLDRAVCLRRLRRLNTLLWRAFFSHD